MAEAIGTDLYVKGELRSHAIFLHMIQFLLVVVVESYKVTFNLNHSFKKLKKKI